MTRRADLAKVHIAKKALRLDEETYRDIIATISHGRTTTAADLDHAERHALLDHFRSRGWKPRPKQRSKRNGKPRPQAGLIYHIWNCLADAGEVHPHALGQWLRSNTKSLDRNNEGWSRPDFLPNDASQKVTEMLKKWADRLNIDWKNGR